MTIKSKRIVGAFIALALLAPLAVSAEAFVDIEGGAALSGYNDVAIPSDTGSKVSLADETPAGLIPVIRVRVGYTFADRHTISILAAPLTAKGTGTADSEISYQGTVFPAGSEITSIYRFDSYRISYRWDFFKNDAIDLGIGLTAKIRSADIAIAGDAGYANRSDLGFVPIINFRADWRFSDPFSLILDGDALVTPFGRAEDAQLALAWRYSDAATFRLGYRVLEGGSDGGGNVYTFALFHYATAGITVRF
ncbi:hypothetical protein MASR2M78_24790 [Treponema sp.]